MKQCQKLDASQFEAARTEFGQVHRYVPGGKGRAFVRFEFSLKPAEVGESIFVILSSRTQTAVYHGPYQSQVSVEIDDNLSADEGYDHLEFWLLRLEEKQSCMWVNEQGAPYWNPGALVTIEFLPEPTVDDEGLRKRFNVTIR